MTGRSGGKMKAFCDICICIPSDVTARIQEAHLLVEHLVCQRIEE
jgi:D-sedoheptulose 7-phosphate isomerase